MQNITISVEKLQQILLLIEEIKAGHAPNLQPQADILLAAVDSLLTLYGLLQGRTTLGEVRKLFGIKTSRPQGGEQESKNADQDVCLQGRDEQPNPASDHQTSAPSLDEQASPSDLAAESNTSQDSKVDPPKREKKPPNQEHPGKSSVDDYAQARKCHHYHPELKPGDPCPSCLKGRLYEERPRRQLLFEGGPPISPVAHISHDLRCNFCKEIFPAQPSDEAKVDGLGCEDRFGYSAIAMIVVLRYFSQLPWYRNCRVHDMVGINLAPSSQYDQCEKLANALQPLDKLSQLLASQASLFMVDDTSGKILSKRQAVVAKRATGELALRDGCHSSVAIAFLEEGTPLIRIKTDIIHAGEWMDELLKDRPRGLAPPKVMWDRLSSNTVGVIPIIDVACNQHARQNFKECCLDAPKLIMPILALFKEMFRQDSLTGAMDPQTRLAHHQEFSQPIFTEIVTRCQSMLDEKKVLPNSNIGRACNYMINHKEALSGFLRYEGAPISNNLVERTILYLVILRKNVHFYKTLLGARVADIILSTGLSAFYLGINVFHYFRLILAHQDEVAANPADWLPWRFRERYPEHTSEYPKRSHRSWKPDSDVPYVRRRIPA